MIKLFEYIADYETAVILCFVIMFVFTLEFLWVRNERKQAIKRQIECLINHKPKTRKF